MIRFLVVFVATVLLTISWSAKAQESASAVVGRGNSYVNVVAYNATGDRWAFGDYQGSVRVFSDGQTEPAIFQMQHRINDLLFLPDGVSVAAVSDYNDGLTIWEWNGTAYTKTKVLDCSEVKTLAHSPLTKEIAFGGLTHLTVWNYEADTFERLYSNREAGFCGSVAYSPDGRFLVGGFGMGHALVTVDRVANTAPEILPQKLAVQNVALSPNGHWFAWTSPASTREGGSTDIYIRDLLSENRLRITKLTAPWPVSDIAFYGNDHLITAGGRGDTRAPKVRDPNIGSAELWLWDIATKRHSSFQGEQHDHIISRVAVHPTKSLLLTASMDKTVRLWKLPELTTTVATTQGQ